MKKADMRDKNNKAYPDVRVQGIPYACISAAPWLDGVSQSQGGTPPFACGNDCLQWTNLNKAQYDRVKQIFKNKGGR